MANKLWEKSVEVNKEIDRFTVGRDRELDLFLAKYDVMGSMAHIIMLESIGLLSKDELAKLLDEMRKIYQLAERGDFHIEEDVEDVHSQVELMLTRALGDIGKKIHSGRSRNDQVLVDLKLFTRDRLMCIAERLRRYSTNCRNRVNATMMCSCLAILICRWLCPVVSAFGLVPMPRVWWMICCFCRQPIRWPIAILSAPPQDTAHLFLSTGL